MVGSALVRAKERHENNKRNDRFWLMVVAVFRVVGVPPLFTIDDRFIRVSMSEEWSGGSSGGGQVGECVSELNFQYTTCIVYRVSCILIHENTYTIN